MRKNSIAIWVAWLTLAGCPYLTPSPDPPTTEGTWAAERDRFTRTRKVYNVLADVAFATATYQAQSVRVARVNRLAEWRGTSPGEREALLAKELAEADEFDDFFLSFYTDDRRANDLDKTPGTWRVTLAWMGREVAPTKIELLRPDPTVQILYPYVDSFRRLYLIRFARPRGSPPLVQFPFELRIAGAPGRVDMEWSPRAP